MNRNVAPVRDVNSSCFGVNPVLSRVEM